MGVFMDQYDIREQIKKESRNKFIGEVGLMLFLFVIVLLVVFVGDIPNPMRMRIQTNGDQLLKDYHKGIDYVRVSDKSLEYTGYYSKAKDGHIKYYCYAVVLEGKKFFVFVPSNRFKDMPLPTINNYSFTARLHKDKKLISKVAQDYNMTSSEWNQLDIISDVVLDEANKEQVRFYIIWIAMGMILLLCCAYGYLSFRNSKNIYKRKEVSYLSVYGDVDSILDTINDEILDKLLFDSNHIKITENYVVILMGGSVFLENRKSITKVQVVKKVKKVYGIVKIGYENVLQFMSPNFILFETPVESDVEIAEIVELMS